MLLTQKGKECIKDTCSIRILSWCNARRKEVQVSVTNSLCCSVLCDIASVCLYCALRLVLSSISSFVLNALSCIAYRKVKSNQFDQLFLDVSAQSSARVMSDHVIRSQVKNLEKAVIRCSCHTSIYFRRGFGKK